MAPDSRGLDEPQNALPGVRVRRAYRIPYAAIRMHLPEPTGESQNCDTNITKTDCQCGDRML